jgi:hypothetical protein
MNIADSNRIRTAYHVTPIVNLPSIIKHGLIPAIGSRSQACSESIARVYFFPDRETCDEALGSWLGDEFEAVADGGLSIIEVLLDPDIPLSSDSAYEIASTHVISSRSIKNITNEEGCEINLIHGDIQSHNQGNCLVLNHTLFGMDIAQFAHDHIELIADTHGCGWLDGGCLIFAKALHLWSDGAIKIFSINGLFSDGTLIVDHAVGIIHVEGAPFPVCIDANGVGSQDDALSSLFIRPGHSLTPFPFGESEIPEDIGLSKTLSKLLQERFGDFDAETLMIDLIDSTQTDGESEFSKLV